MTLLSKPSNKRISGRPSESTSHKNFHATDIEVAADCELVGIMARAPATVAQAPADWPQLPIFDSIGKLIDSGVDAVTIPTPPATGL